MIDKKGQDGSGIQQLLVMGIIGIIIIILVLLNPTFISWITEKIPNILPTYNNTKPPINVPIILRYNILQDDVEYYDTTTWRQFPDWETPEKFGKVNLTKGNARYYFDTYYYSGRNLPELFEPYPYEDVNIEAFNNALRGSVIMTKRTTENGEKAIQNIILTPKNQLLNGGLEKVSTYKPLEGDDKIILPVTLKDRGYSGSGLNRFITVPWNEIAKRIGATAAEHAQAINEKSIAEVQFGDDPYGLKEIDRKENKNTRTTSSVTTYALTHEDYPTGLFVEISRSGRTGPLHTALITTDIQVYARRLQTTGTNLPGNDAIKNYAIEWRDSVLNDEMSLKVNDNQDTVTGPVEKNEWRGSVYLVFDSTK